LKEKIKSKSAEMRDVWTNDWKLDLHSDGTKEYVQELIDLRAGLANLRDSRFASLRNKTQAREDLDYRSHPSRCLGGRGFDYSKACSSPSAITRRPPRRSSSMWMTCATASAQT
jgi:hypothetical protein